MKVKDYLTKIKNYNTHFDDDIILNGQEFQLLKSVVARLKRVQRTVGHANFALLNFDAALVYSRNYSKVGAFPKEEIEFLENIFYRNANDYGFYGEKVMTNLTDSLNRTYLKEEKK